MGHTHPNLAKNLLSTTQLTHHSYNTKITNTRCQVYSNTNQHNVLRPILLGQMLMVQLSIPAIKQALTTSASLTTATTLHHQLRHISESHLRSFTQHAHIKLAQGSVNQCETCIQSKATCMPISKKQVPQATAPLELVHTNISGPLNTPTKGGHTYYITFRDDHTKYTQVYLLHHKSNTINTLQDYLNSTPKEYHCQKIH